MAEILGVIPARLASTRLPRKMLAPINGRPLIYWTWRQTKRARLLDEVAVGTESVEIYDAVVKFGGKAVMASGNHASGTERVAETAAQFPWAKFIINVQGDEPLLSPSAIDAVARTLLENPDVPVATAAARYGSGDDIADPGCAKVVLDMNGDALYFSRSVIPYPRENFSGYLRHIGVYGFRREFLYRYAKMKLTPLENAEGLEQLRILQNGVPIRVVVGKFTSISVDTPRDLKRVRLIMKNG